MAKTYLKVKAFTLSEVLLVLSVIGVVAALTIPTLIQKVGNDQSVASLKKEYSTFSQASLQIASENGGSLEGNAFNGAGTMADNANVMSMFASKLNLIKNCGSGTGCWYTSTATQLNGNTWYTNPDSNLTGGKAVLADGTLLTMYDNAGNCTSDYGDGPLDGTVCGYVYFDINGNTPPNKMGRDIFCFLFTKTGAVYPHGSYNAANDCTTSLNGHGCAYKILTEGAMNY